MWPPDLGMLKERADLCGEEEGKDFFPEKVKFEMTVKHASGDIK